MTPASPTLFCHMSAIVTFRLQGTPMRNAWCDEINWGKAWCVWLPPLCLQVCARQRGWMKEGSYSSLFLLRLSLAPVVSAFLREWDRGVTAVETLWIGPHKSWEEIWPAWVSSRQSPSPGIQLQDYRVRGEKNNNKNSPTGFIQSCITMIPKVVCGHKFNLVVCDRSLSGTAAALAWKLPWSSLEEAVLIAKYFSSTLTYLQMVGFCVFLNLKLSWCRKCWKYFGIITERIMISCISNYYLNNCLRFEQMIIKFPPLELE